MPVKAASRPARDPVRNEATEGNHYVMAPIVVCPPAYTPR